MRAGGTTQRSRGLPVDGRLLLDRARHGGLQRLPTRPQPRRHQLPALVYTLDLLLPIVNFGQTFGVAGDAQRPPYLLTALGRLLFTAVAAALTRNLSRS
jgi:hypothetical protein